MTSLPRPGPFDAYAVTARQGPHVTLQAGVIHLRRHWTTTTRHSVKARSIRRNGWASATVAEHGRRRMVGGPAAVLDPRRPWTFAAAPVAGAAAGGALLRLGAGRLDQLLGYAETGRGVPDAFMPWGRVLLVTDITHELVLDGDDVVDARGRWAERPAQLHPEAARSEGRAVEGLARVPPDLVHLATAPGPCWLGLATSEGAVTVPGEWHPDLGWVRVGRAVLAAIGATLPGPVCVTVDDSGDRRPDHKLGVMLRGAAALIDADATSAVLALTLRRVTYWRGFDTATVEAGS